jgi:hypothetical protein
MIPSILKLRTKWRLLVSLTARSMYPSENSQPYPLNIGRMGIRTARGTLQDRKNLLLLAVIELRFLGRLENFVPDTVKIEGLQTALYRNWCTGIPLHKSSSFDSQDKILDIKILNALSLLSDGSLPSVKVWANDPFRVWMVWSWHLLRSWSRSRFPSSF